MLINNYKIILGVIMKKEIKEKIRIFNVKNEIIRKEYYLNYKEVDLSEFILGVFSRNEKLPFQKKGKYDPQKYNAIFVEVNGRQSKSWILTEDLELLDYFENKDFIITSPITYVGRNRTSKNARFCYGLAFDIDGVKEKHMKDILHQMKTEHIPVANFIVNSGNGVHLYYLFKEPIALFENIKKMLKDFKYSLTKRLWNAFTSSIKYEQFQGIFQGFRIPGTKTKFGETVTVFANLDNYYYSISELNSYIYDKKLTDEEIEIIERAKYVENRMSLKEAKEKYPDWYERRIVKGEKKGRWKIKRDLYDWWLKKIKTEEVREGHRYFCIMCLAIYAVKCSISYEELKKDAYSLLDFMDELTISNDNHFTEEDIEDALRAYLDSYMTFPRKDIEKITGIRIDPNKRNGRKQKEHLKIMKFVRDNITHQNGVWREKNGRPVGSGTKLEMVQKWRKENPQGTKYGCAKELGISRTTVIKWWNGDKK